MSSKVHTYAPSVMNRILGFAPRKKLKFQPNGMKPEHVKLSIKRIKNRKERRRRKKQGPRGFTLCAADTSLPKERNK